MNQTIEKIIKERQTVKAYADKPISKEDWQQIVDVIEWSPTSFGAEPYRVLVIHRTPKTEALRKELQGSMWGQGVVIEADKLVFFIAYTKELMFDGKWLFDRELRKVVQLRGLKGDEAKAAAEKSVAAVTAHLTKYEPDATLWAAKQTYIALGNAMSAATILGFGSTPMEGFNRDEIQAILTKHKLLKHHEHVAVAAAFGYPKSESAYAHWGSGKRVREAVNEKFTDVK